MKIVILHDLVPPGARPDLDDNLVQAREVAEALERLGHQASCLAFSDGVEEMTGRLERLGVDLVFNLVETPLGQARIIHMVPMLLERLGLAYTGVGPRGMLLTSNKLLAKRKLQESGLPTPGWWSPRGGETPAPKGSCLVKSVWEHGSLGLDDLRLIPGDDAARLAQEVEALAARLGGDCFAEQYVEGREFNISLLGSTQGPQVLPPAEIVFKGYDQSRLKVIGYRAKWEPDSFEYNHTPRCYDFPESDRALLAELNRISRECWHLFGLRGWARVDFRVDQEGQPWILEVNANPCLSADAGFMAACQRAGFTPQDAVGRILADRTPRRRKTTPAR